MIRSRQRPRVGSGGGASSSLALRLDFLSSTSLDPRVTFSRGTNATLIDSTGKLTYAPSNQVLNSESFTNTSTWPRTTSNVTSNATVAPDGTTTADKLLTDGTAGALHYIATSISGQSGVNYTYSLYVKAAELSQVSILIPTALAGATTQVTFDTATNPASVIGTVGSPLWSNITAVGNGWYRIAIAVAATATASGGAQIKLAKNGSNTFDGNSVDGLYIWGAQFGAMTYETAPRAYNSTTLKNLLGRTEEFDNAAWGRTNIGTITANSTIAPNDTTTADEISDNATVGQHQVVQNIPIVIETVYTLSCYVKNNTARYARVALGGTFNFTAAAFDLELGIVQSGSSASATITSVGNGWFRVSISSTAASTGNGTIAIGITNSTGTAYGGPGNSLFFWGAQLSDSASVDPYVYNPAAALTSTAYYGPRFEYDPNAAYSTDNLLEFPTEFSNAAWAKTNLIIPINENTAVDPTGYMGAEKLIPNTTAGVAHSVGQNQNTTIGTTLTGSVYVKAAGYNFGAVLLLTTFAAAQILIIDLSTGAVTLTSGSPLATSVTDAGNGWWRISITQITNATGTTTLQVRPAEIGTTTNFTGDGTSGIYAWGAQLTESAATVPFFYYPYTPLGLLIEEARTNLLLNSATLSTQNITTTAQAYTLSFYGTGTVTLSGTSTAGPLVGTGIFPNRVSLTFTPTAGTLTLTVSGIVSNAQLEAGGFATSYIPTAGASVTRSADNATMVSNNFTNWYNQNNGTFDATYIQPTVATGLFPSIFAARLQSANNSINTIEAFASTSGTFDLVRIANVDQATLTLGGGNSLAGTSRNVAFAYKVNDFASAYDGTFGATDTSGSLTNFDIFNIGWAGSNVYINTRIKSISYYNTRLTNAQLQAITA